MKRVCGGISGINSDSKNKTEVDTTVTTVTGGVAVAYRAHISKCSKAEHQSPRQVASEGLGLGTPGEPLLPKELPHEEKLRKQVCFSV